ncbi:hypothetical protein M8J75_014807 [Diaphorina citri]|nr:hypothetical protein M8J75_014807 [Diaphorina citri]
MNDIPKGLYLVMVILFSVGVNSTVLKPDNSTMSSSTCGSAISSTQPNQPPLFLSDDQVRDLLDWESLVPAIESVMVKVSKKEVIQPARLFMRIPEVNGVLLSMPGYIKRTGPDGEDSLAIKVVTSFTDNKVKGLPSVLATVLLYNTDNGKLKVVMEGTEITKWRTAAASVVATKHLFGRSGDKDLVLAIMGSGAQAYIHAKAFHINIWNHRYAGAQSLVEKLTSEGVPAVQAYEHGEDAARDADILVTATYSSVPVLKYEWLTKKDAHINAVGAGLNHHSELDSAIYSHSSIFFDSEAAARGELKGLYEQVPANMVGEVGGLIAANLTRDARYPLTVFHSMGMATEDVITAKLIYDKYQKQHSNCSSPQ